MYVLDPDTNQSSFPLGPRTRLYRNGVLLPEHTLITPDKLTLGDLPGRMPLEDGDILYTGDLFFLFHDGGFEYMYPIPSLADMYARGRDTERAWMEVHG